MRVYWSVLLMAGAMACSSAPDLQPQTPAGPEVPQGEPSSGGAMKLRGMPEMEAAKLKHWQGVATVTQGVDGAKDTLELSVSALDESGTVEGSVHVSKQIDAQSGLQISGDYVLSEMGMNSQPHQLNVTVNGALYRSISGRVTLKHALGKIRGTFEAQLVRDGDAESKPIALSGSLEGWMALGCHALRPATPDPEAQGGELEIDGNAPQGPSWVAVGSSHDFCRSYL